MNWRRFWLALAMAVLVILLAACEGRKPYEFVAELEGELEQISTWNSLSLCRDFADIFKEYAARQGWHPLAYCRETSR
jgi:hypothetical protein